MVQERKKIKKIGIITIISLIIMIVVITFIKKSFEPDLFFDIKTGESLLSHGLDFKDHFSFIPNLTYMYHHWLYDLIIFFIYKVSGYMGIFLFFVLIFTLFGISVFYVNNKYSNNKIISTILALFTIYICTYAFQSRVQSITYLLFFLEVYLIERLYIKGSKKSSVFLIIISILIANLHMPLWIFNLILYLPYLFEFLMKLIIDKFKKINSIISDKLTISGPVNKKVFIITFIIVLITGFLTPLKLFPYTFFTKSLFNNSFSFIGEMGKTPLIYFGWIIVFEIIFSVILFLKNAKIKLRDLMLFWGIFIFSLIAVRNVVYTYIFFPTLITKIVFESYNIKFNFKKISKIFSRINKNVVQLFTITGLFCIYVFLLYRMDFKKFDYNIKETYPTKTVEYIKENLDYKNIKLYNDFNYGSYLAFCDIPVFIDNRAEVYIKEFNGGHDIVGDYLKSKNFSDYKEVFDKYDFDYSLVYKDSNVYYYLEADSDFKLVYDEEYYALFKTIGE